MPAFAKNSDEDAFQDTEEHDAGGGDDGEPERCLAHVEIAAQGGEVGQRDRRCDHDSREGCLGKVLQQRGEEEQE